MELDVFFAGTAGSAPTPRRGLPALLVRRGGDRLLFDCGEGTQRQLIRTVGLPDVECVFLTHLHADHWLGLPGMLKSFELREREQPLDIYGPSVDVVAVVPAHPVRFVRAVRRRLVDGITVPGVRVPRPSIPDEYCLIVSKTPFAPEW